MRRMTGTAPGSQTRIISVAVFYFICSISMNFLNKAVSFSLILRWSVVPTRTSIFLSVLRIRDIVVRIRADQDPDPAIFVIKLQDANKKLNFSAYYFLKVYLHHFSKMKGHKEVTKQKESRFPYYLNIFYDRRIQ
jgi:hypothetical protein